MTLTPEQIAELRRLNAERTKGRWRVDPFGDYVEDATTILVSRDPDSGANLPISELPREDAAFIAAIANAADALLSAAESEIALRAEFDENVNRLKACEHIAEGEPEWESIADLCPSTAAVASLRAENARLREALQWIADRTPEADSFSTALAPEFVRLGRAARAALEPSHE